MSKLIETETEAEVYSSENLVVMSWLQSALNKRTVSHMVGTPTVAIQLLLITVAAFYTWLRIDDYLIRSQKLSEFLCAVKKLTGPSDSSKPVTRWSRCRYTLCDSACGASQSATAYTSSRINAR